MRVQETIPELEEELDEEELEEELLEEELEEAERKQKPALILLRAAFKQSGSELLLLAEQSFISETSSHLNIPSLSHTGLLSTHLGRLEVLTSPHRARVILFKAVLRQIGSESLLFAVHNLIAPVSQVGEKFGLEHLLLPSSQKALFTSAV